MREPGPVARRRNETRVAKNSKQTAATEPKAAIYLANLGPMHDGETGPTWLAGPGPSFSGPSGDEDVELPAR